jgi:hypothetical protein
LVVVLCVFESFTVFFIESALIGTGTSNNALSPTSVVLGGESNVAGVSGDATIVHATVLTGQGNNALGGEFIFLAGMTL